MLISQSPLRISLGGGGTDLPSFYEKFGGFLVAGAINKYIYVCCNKPFSEEIILNYSERETVSSTSHIEHPIYRTVLDNLNIKGSIELHSIADIPAGTGLGSSGAFTVALIQALKKWQGHPYSTMSLAELACEIEINHLNQPIGKQDQYASAFGGLNTYEFKPDGTVNVVPIKLPQEDIDFLGDHLLLFYTGEKRSASAFLQDQNKRSKSNDEQMIENLKLTKDMGYQSVEAIEKLDIEKYGQITQKHWDNKIARSPNMAPENVIQLHADGMNCGAIGGKLIGAGGQGFVMFVSDRPNKLRAEMRSKGYTDTRFSFDRIGAHISHDSR